MTGTEESQSQPVQRGSEWFDTKTGMWLSREGYEVCQDHTGPLDSCPYKHDARRRG